MLWLHIRYSACKMSKLNADRLKIISYTKITKNKHKCVQKVAKEDVCWYIFVCVVVSLHDLLYVVSAKKVLSVLGESNIDLILSEVNESSNNISLLELSPYSLNVFM